MSFFLAFKHRRFFKNRLLKSTKIFSLPKGIGGIGGIGVMFKDNAVRLNSLYHLLLNMRGKRNPPFAVPIFM